MRVAYAAQGLADGAGGLRAYSRQLLGALLSLDDRPQVELFRAGRAALQREPDATDPSPAVHHLRVPTWLVHRLAVVGGLQIDRWAGRPDLFHSPDAMAPATAAPQVLTVHDLIPFRLPQLFRGESDAPGHAAYREGMRRSLPRAARVIAVSEATRRDLLQQFPDLDPDRVRTIPYGTPRPPPGYAPQPPPASHDPADRRHRILFMGRVEPRKDLLTATAAVARLRAGGVDAVLEVHGAVVGRTGAEIAERARAAAGGAGWLQFMGQNPDPWSAYRGASALLYPSLYEGFGLPPFEAFAAGVPVVASNAASLSELLAGAALLCDPGDVDGFAAALAEAIAEPAPLIAAGAERARAYSWESTARQVVEVWRDVA